MNVSITLKDLDKLTSLIANDLDLLEKEKENLENQKIGFNLDDVKEKNHIEIKETKKLYNRFVNLLEKELN